MLPINHSSQLLLYLILLLSAKRPILSTIGHPRNRIMTCTTKCRPLMTSSKVRIGDTIKGLVLVAIIFSFFESQIETTKGQISPGMVIKGHFIPDLKHKSNFGQRPISITVPPPPPTIHH